MDLNGDGRIDILSGSYSQYEQPMAGLFQVLWGKEGGGWSAPEPLKGDDGNLLIITPFAAEGGGEHDVDLDRICTRPMAVDLDGDGKLDLVTGNFGGTFAVFAGLGNGKFAAKNVWLMRNGERLRAGHHSDPFVVDWDGDGDFDLLGGSADGGAFLCLNEGDAKAPKWGPTQTLLAAAERHDAATAVRFGEDHINGPMTNTRVWVADVDGDGKLDLLVGDQAMITTPAMGLDEDQARRKLADWNAALQKLIEDERRKGDQGDMMSKAFEEHWQARGKIVTEQSTGFVWLLRRK